MCRVTGTSVVRPHHYYPSDNGNAASHISVPPKSSLRRSPSPKSVVLPSSHKKTVSFAVADVTSQVSQKFEKDDMEHPSSEPNVLTTIHEAALPLASSMSPSEKAEIWWQSHDYSIFSGTARLISGEIRRRAVATSMASAAAARSTGAHNEGEGSSSTTKAHAESYANVLAQVLEACSLAAASFSITTSTPSDEENDVKNLPLNPSLFAYLAHWTRSGHSRRGLERWSVAYHGSKRNEDRERQIQAVLIAQTEFSSSDDKDNKIKAASESHSRAARLFALTIGHADAAAVGASYPS